MGPRFLLLVAVLAAAGCRHRSRSGGGPRVDWDRAAFAILLVRQEYQEQTEHGDFAVVPALVSAVDGAREAIAPAGAAARWLDASLGDLRTALSRHANPRAVSRICFQLAAELSRRGVPLRVPRARPDLGRGAALYRLACAPCHGPPRGPPPPAAAHLVPPPPRPTESALTPYEVFERITYGGAGTAMPSFAESLPESGRWDIAFYLFADTWPPCESSRWSPLSAAALAHMSDRDLWDKYGWGAAACLRRNYR